MQLKEEGLDDLVWDGNTNLLKLNPFLVEEKEKLPMSAEHTEANQNWKESMKLSRWVEP